MQETSVSRHGRAAEAAGAAGPEAPRGGPRTELRPTGRPVVGTRCARGCPWRPRNQAERKPGGKRQLIGAPGNLVGLGDETWSSGLPGRPALGGPNPRRNKEKTTRRRESLALSISPLRDAPNPTLHEPRRKWLLRDRKSEQNFRRIYGHEDKGVRVQGPPRKENTTVSVGPLDAAGPQEQGTSGMRLSEEGLKPGRTHPRP